MALRKLDEPSIDPADPWRNDDLQRKAAGETLVRLVQGSAGSPTISLKGSWGSGKSIFMKRVAASLELKQTPVATLDAWRSEYLRDPGLALAGALLERVALERQQKLGLDLRARLEEAAEKFGVAASRLSEVLSRVAAQVHGEAAPDEPTTRSTSVARSILGVQLQQRTALREFRAGLAEIRALMFEARKLDPRSKAPLVFMVDELDRCRPEFALGALDRIKQHFDVDGIAFVVATDGETLPAAVLRLRGGGVDAERYLRKFFDFEFHLPDPDPARFVPVLSYQCRVSDLIPEQLTLPQLTNEWHSCAQQFLNERTHRGHDVAELLETFPQIASALKLSLRDQILAFTAVTATMRVAPPGVELLPALLVFCLSLRYAAPAVFERLRTGRSRISQILAPDALPAELGHTALAQGWLSDTDTGAFVRHIALALGNPSPRDRSAEFQKLMDELAARREFRSIAPIRRASVRVARITEPDPDAYLAGALRMAERFGAGAEG